MSKGACLGLQAGDGRVIAAQHVLLRADVALQLRLPGHRGLHMAPQAVIHSRVAPLQGLHLRCRAALVLLQLLVKPRQCPLSVQMDFLSFDHGKAQTLRLLCWPALMLPKVL